MIELPAEIQILIIEHAICACKYIEVGTINEYSDCLESRMEHVEFNSIVEFRLVCKLWNRAVSTIFKDSQIMLQNCIYWDNHWDTAIGDLFFINNLSKKHVSMFVDVYAKDFPSKLVRLLTDAGEYSPEELQIDCFDAINIIPELLRCLAAAAKQNPRMISKLNQLEINDPEWNEDENSDSVDLLCSNNYLRYFSTIGLYWSVAEGQDMLSFFLHRD